MLEALHNMVVALRRRHEENGEGGFTLIELMVVVLIIAILMAIAIPTFLGARSRANDTAAQADLRNALTAEQAAYSGGSQSYAVASNLSSEGNLSFVTSAGDATKNTVAVTTSDGSNAVCLSTLSKSGKWFGLVAAGSTDTSINAGDYYFTGTSGGTDPCGGTLPGTGALPTGWSSVPW
ncbi:MAG: type IV pilin protein [Acidimicrobiales bacterium]